MGCSTSSLTLVTNEQITMLPVPNKESDTNSVDVATTSDIQDDEVFEDNWEIEKDLFCDEDFPADQSSIGELGELPFPVTWWRPHELSDNPVLISDESGRCDLKQGSLSDSWIMAAMSGLAQYPHLKNKVLDPNQVLFGPKYDGSIRVNLWKFGRWKTVVIDDRLPVFDWDETYCLPFANCANTNEFWVPLLEKAIAKWNTSYAALNEGLSWETLPLLTGGVQDMVVLGTDPYQVDLDGMLGQLKTALETNAVITCRYKDQESEETESPIVDKKKITGQAYRVTGVSEVTLSDQEKVNLVRVWDPSWNSVTEWKGAWSDGDEIWDKVSDEVRKDLESDLSSPNGEFWIGLDDFGNDFEPVVISHVVPDLDIISGKIEGVWDETAPDWWNQQYLLKVEPMAAVETSVIIISLMQGAVEGSTQMLKPIGFPTYKIGGDTSRTVKDEYLSDLLAFPTHSYVDFDEATRRLEMKPGYYVVIPLVMGLEQGEKRSFLLRAYSVSGLKVSFKLLT